jgi:hypothetical protein
VVLRRYGTAWARTQACKGWKATACRNNPLRWAVSETGQGNGGREDIRHPRIRHGPWQDRGQTTYPPKSNRWWSCTCQACRAPGTGPIASHVGASMLSDRWALKRQDPPVICFASGTASVSRTVGVLHRFFYVRRGTVQSNCLLLLGYW